VYILDYRISNHTIICCR